MRLQDSKHRDVFSCTITFCYLAVLVGKIATAEDFKQWDLSLQAAKTMLRCLHVTVLKLWGMHHSHLTMSHHVDEDFIAQLEASGELQIAQTATYMKDMTELLGMHCLATAVALAVAAAAAAAAALRQCKASRVPSSSLQQGSGALRMFKQPCHQAFTRHLVAA